MELISIITRLWRRRILTGLAFVVAVAIGITMGRGPTSTTQIASAPLVFQSHLSQVVDGGNTNTADTLTPRVAILGDYLTTRDMAYRIAADAHVPVSDLMVVNSSVSMPVVGTDLPAALKANEPAGSTYTLTVADPDPQLPILELTGAAPDATTAARLVTAAADAMAAVVDGGASQAKPVVELAAKPQIHAIVHRTPHVYIAAITLVVFIVFCTGIVMIPMRRRPQRTSGRPQPV